jgi:hypothetical protein
VSGPIAARYLADAYAIGSRIRTADFMPPITGHLLPETRRARHAVLSPRSGMVVPTTDHHVRGAGQIRPSILGNIM